LKTKKNGKIGGKKREIFRTNIIKEKNSSSIFKKKIGKIEQKNTNFCFFKETKKRKTKR
jgi:hypothetical protein